MSNNTIVTVITVVVVISLCIILSILVGTGIIVISKTQDTTTKIKDTPTPTEDLSNIQIKHKATNRCIEKSSDKQLNIADCNPTATSQRWTYLPQNQALKFYDSELCLETNDGITLNLIVCNNKSAQKWKYDNNFIKHPQTSNCISLLDNGVYLTDCNDATSSNWIMTPMI